MSSVEQQEQPQQPQQPSNKILISRSKTLHFYVHLAKRYLQEQGTIELSGLGQAINTVVSCAEILKNQNLAEITNIETSTTQLRSNEDEDVQFSKAKIQVTLKKSDKFDELMAQEQKEIEERKIAKQAQEQKSA